MRSTVRDGRRLPFFQVVKEDLLLISGRCARPDVTVKLSAVRSVYFALLEFANDERADETNVTRKALAERAGVSSRTSQDATGVLEAVGLLRVDVVQGAGADGNIWTLISPDPTEQPLPGQPSSHCLPTEQPLPGPIETGQEGEEEPPVSPVDEVQVVFDRWQRKISPRAELDNDRRGVIRRALVHSSLADCLRAIDGCAASDFHMARGESKGGTKYNQLSLILRNREKIESFGERAQTAGVDGTDEGLTPVERDRMRAAKQAVQRAFDMPQSEAAQQQGEQSERWLREHGILVVREPGGARPTFRRAADTGGGGVLDVDG